MARWQFVLATVDGDPIADLLNAKGRRVTWRRDAAADATFTIDGRWAPIDGSPPAASGIEELLTDLLVYRNGDLLFRGRIGATEDSLGPSEHSVSVAAVDYRGLLDRRIVLGHRGYGADEQTAIAWDLIDFTQGETAGDLGITQGEVDVSGVLRDWHFHDGKKIAEGIDDMARAEDGFEWEIDARLHFNAWYPQRGSTRDFVAEYGATVASVRRQVDPSEYANVVYASGDGTTTTGTTAVATDLASRDEGRFEAVVGAPDMEEQTVIDETAAGELARRQVIQPSYACTLAPERWSPGDAWIGDTTTLVIRSGRLDVVTQERIEEITVNVGESGDETVELVYGKARRESLARQLRKAGARLSNLERR